MKYEHCVIMKSKCSVGDTVRITHASQYNGEVKFNSVTPIKVLKVELRSKEIQCLLENNRGERKWVPDERCYVFNSQGKQLEFGITTEYENIYNVGDKVQVQVVDNMWQHNAKVLSFDFNPDVLAIEYMVEYGEERIIVQECDICHEI